jgi:hypothetical protein
MPIKYWVVAVQTRGVTLNDLYLKLHKKSIQLESTFYAFACGFLFNVLIAYFGSVISDRASLFNWNSHSKCGNAEFEIANKLFTTMVTFVQRVEREMGI